MLLWSRTIPWKRRPTYHSTLIRTWSADRSGDQRVVQKEGRSVVQKVVRKEGRSEDRKAVRKAVRRALWTGIWNLILLGLWTFWGGPWSQKDCSDCFF